MVRLDGGDSVGSAVQTVLLAGEDYLEQNPASYEVPISGPRGGRFLRSGKDFLSFDADS